jgi:hypothetical protein
MLVVNPNQSYVAACMRRKVLETRDSPSDIRRCLRKHQLAASLRLQESADCTLVSRTCDGGYSGYRLPKYHRNCSQNHRRTLLLDEMVQNWQHSISWLRKSSATEEPNHHPKFMGYGVLAEVCLYIVTSMSSVYQTCLVARNSHQKSTGTGNRRPFHASLITIFESRNLFDAINESPWG